MAFNVRKNKSRIKYKKLDLKKLVAKLNWKPLKLSKDWYGETSLIQPRIDTTITELIEHIKKHKPLKCPHCNRFHRTEKVIEECKEIERRADVISKLKTELRYSEKK